MYAKGLFVPGWHQNKVNGNGVTKSTRVPPLGRMKVKINQMNEIKLYIKHLFRPTSQFNSPTRLTIKPLSQ